MIYPPFAMDEFDCLKPDLSGPKAMWKYRELERILSRYESDAQKTQSRFISNKDVRQLVEDEILASKAESTGLETADKLHSIVEEIKRLIQKRQIYGKDYQKYRHTELIGIIRNMYSSFDIEKFKKDFTASFPSAKMNDTEKSHRKSIRDAEKQRNKIDKEYDWTQHFKSVPHSWRGMSRKTVGENKVAETICRKFLDTWAERQGNFSHAVTINGVLIESLPVEKKKLWGDTWKEFGIDKIVRSEIFSYTLHGQEAEPVSPAPKSVPKEFHKVD